METDLQTMKTSQSTGATDPRTHETAVRIAQHCTWIIQAVLREEERIEAAREFFVVAREELEKLRDGPGQPNAESSAARSCELVVSRDESVRDDASAEALAALKPAFKKDGTVTAGNAPGVNDAAAAVVVMSAEKAKELGRRPLVTIRAQATTTIRVLPAG